MNPALNMQLHGLLNKAGLMPQKADLVTSFTKGRSESSKELTNDEAKEMITYLTSITDASDAASQKMRRRIISMAHEMHWHLPGTQAINMQRLNEWCENFSYDKKKLNAYTYNELPKLVTQFKIVYKDYLSKL
jgi:hypothetical protein